MFDSNFLTNILKPLKPIRDPEEGLIIMRVLGTHYNDSHYIRLEGGQEIVFKEYEIMQLHEELRHLRCKFNHATEVLVRNRIRFFLFSRIRKVQHA